MKKNYIQEVKQPLHNTYALNIHTILLIRQSFPATRQTWLIRISNWRRDPISTLSHSPHTLYQLLSPCLLCQYLCQLLGAYHQLNLPNPCAIIPRKHLSFCWWSLQHPLVIKRHAIRSNFGWWSRWRQMIFGIAVVSGIVQCDTAGIYREEVVELANVEFFVVEERFREEVTATVDGVARKLVGYALCCDGCVQLHDTTICCHNFYHFFYF